MRGTPHQVSLLLRRRAGALERAIREAETRSLLEALAVARSLSTGGLSRGDLRRLGHPYRVTGGGVLPQDPALVNLASGAFYLGWKTIGPRKSAEGLVSRLVNDSAVAEFLIKGTRVMRPRPILTRIRSRTALSRARRHRRALSEIHRAGV